MTDDRMTPTDRRELATVIRLRANVARQDAEMRTAQLLADFEEQLATEYPSDDPRWKDVAARVQEMARAGDEEIARICRNAGIRPEFRPGLAVGWYGRGENAVRERRAELRKVAQTRAAAMLKQAKLAITRTETEARSRLAELSLTSGEAKDLLAWLPTVEGLLPTLALREIESAAPKPRYAAEDDYEGDDT